MSESQVLRAVLAAIGSLQDVLVLRNNCGGFTDSARRFVRFGLGTGTPDLVCLIHGRIFGMEVKSADGRLSKEQQKAHKNWENFGVITWTVRSAAEALCAVWQMRAITDPCGHQECAIDENTFKTCFLQRRRHP